MRRFWYESRSLPIAGLALLIGLASVLVIIPFLAPVDRYRPLLIRYIEENTGRRIEIGHLRLYVLPTLHLTATDVRLTNPPGFPRGDAVAIKTLHLGVAWMELLSRQLDVTYIGATGVRLNLLSTPDGQSNFAPPKPASGAARQGMAATPHRASMLTLERIRAVKATDVVVTIGDVDASGQRETPYLSVSGLNGKAWAFTPRLPDWRKKLVIALDLRGAKLVTPSFTKPAEFRVGELLITGGHAHGNFVASLDTIRFRGAVEIARFVPFSLTFALATPSLDVPRLGRVVALRPGPGQGPAVRPRLVARGTIAADRLVAPPVVAIGGRGALSFYTSGMRVDTYRLSAFGGTVEGTGSLNYSAASLPAAVTIKVRGIVVQRMVTAIVSRARGITGTLDADFRLAMALATDPRTTLAGTGTFAVRHGSFPSVELHRNALTMARILQVTAPGTSIPFTYLGGNLRIAQQHVQSHALRLDGHGLHATAQGSLGFDKTLHLAGVGVLDTEAPVPATSGFFVRALGWLIRKVLPGANGASGVRVPFVVGGTLDEPTFSVTGKPEFVHGQKRGRWERQQVAEWFQPPRRLETVP
jgi:AsmA-like protein